MVGSHEKRVQGTERIEELVLNVLAEISTKGISEAAKPETLDELAKVALPGRTNRRNARMELEKKTGQKVVTSLNARSIRALKKGKEEYKRP